MTSTALPTDSLSVFAAAREEAHRPALIIGGRTLSFEELAAMAARRVHWLAARGVAATEPGPRDVGVPVALLGTSDLGTLVLVYALIAIGCPVAMVHPRLTAAERRAVLDVVQPRLFVDRAPDIDDAAPFEELAPQRPGGLVEPERCLAVLFTSGTTGKPKGVVLSRRAFEASARASARNLGFVDEERWILGLPIAHVGGLSILTRCLIARRTVIVPREVAEGQRLTTDALVRTLEADRATLVSLVPTQLEWLLSERPDFTPPRSLRAVLLGGAAARPALLARAADRGVPVLTTYGLTEACSQVTTQRFGTTQRGELGAGPPVEGVEVRLDEGAIRVRGATLLSGYHGVDASPFDAEGWLSTDDLGRFDEHGNLHVLGRRSDLVITGGENVHPAEVEAVLETCPGVRAACVFGVPDDTWGQIVAVAVVLEPAAASAWEEAFARFVEERLAPHRRPRRIATVPALAVTAAGKLDRKETARVASAELRPLHR